MLMLVVDVKCWKFTGFDVSSQLVQPDLSYNNETLSLMDLQVSFEDETTPPASLQTTQGGPLPVINGGVTPTRVSMEVGN